MLSESGSTDYFLGLMSGTSMDGIDAVIVNFTKTKSSLVCSHFHPLPESIQESLGNIIAPDWKGSLQTIGILNQQLGKLFAEAANALIKKSGLETEQIRAIGSHGQTVWHQPEGEHCFSMQLGDANQISELTNITTVADFRNRDIAARGQGAPLVPSFHAELFQQQTNNRIILNIGGIANITLLPCNDQASGYDTGPGNALMDDWIRKHKNKQYDKNGAWAQSGTVNHKLLKQLLDDPYFTHPAPKSTGKEYFNLKWLHASTTLPLNEIKPEDIQATLTELTSQTIAREINSTTKKYPSDWRELYICGGGIHNNFLLERIQHHLPGFMIRSTEKLGVSPDWMEAIAFAWLAKQTLEGKPGNLPAVTGAKGYRILGAIYPK